MDQVIVHVGCLSLKDTQELVSYVMIPFSVELLCENMFKFSNTGLKWSFRHIDLVRQYRRLSLALTWGIHNMAIRYSKSDLILAVCSGTTCACSKNKTLFLYYFILNVFSLNGKAIEMWGSHCVAGGRVQEISGPSQRIIWHMTSCVTVTCQLKNSMLFGAG